MIVMEEVQTLVLIRGILDVIVVESMGILELSARIRSLINNMTSLRSSTRTSIRATRRIILLLMLQGYTDADWQGDLDDRKSTSGYLLTLAGGAISWSSKKQDSVALSSMEAEYIAASEAVKEAVWLKEFLSTLKIVESASNSVVVYCDNQVAINVSRYPKFHSKIKHIEGRYHYIRDVINRLKSVYLEFLPSTDMVADPLTKSLSQVVFGKHVKAMGLRIFE